MTSLIEKSANASGKAMVQRFLLHNSQPKTTETGNPAHMDEKKDDKENAKEVITRNDIEKLRRFLALRYPRLDGEEHFEYCRQTELPENFDYDKIDNVPKFDQMYKKNETAVALVEDQNDSLAAFSNSGLLSWVPNVHSISIN